MADARTFEIKLTVTSDSHGAVQAHADLDQLAHKTKKAEENTEEFNKKGRELNRIFSEMDRLVPGAGEALKIFTETPMEGVLVGAGAMLGVFVQIHEYLNEIDARARETFSNLVDSANAATTAIQGMQTANEQFWQSLRRHEEEAQSQSDYETAIKQIQDEAAQVQRAADAKKQAELDVIDAALKSGMLTQDQAAARKNQIEAFYRNLAAGQARGETADEQKARAGRIDDLAKSVEALTEEVKNVQRINTSAGAVARDTDIEEVKKFMSDLATAYKNGFGLGLANTDVNVPEIFRKIDPKIGDKVMPSQENFESFTKEARQIIAGLTKDKADRESAQKNLEDSLTKAQDELAQLRTEQAQSLNRTAAIAGVQGQIDALNRLSDQLKQLQDLGVFGKSQITYVPNRPDLTRIKNPAVEDIVNQGAGALMARQHLFPGHRLTEQQQQQIALLEQMLQALGWTPQFIALFERTLALHQNSYVYMRGIELRIAQLEQQVKNNARPQQ